MVSNKETILRIRSALRKKNMTQRDLAVSLGKKEAEILRWLNGCMGISEMNLQKIEEILDTPLTMSSLAYERLSHLRIGVIGTGSIAKRFVDESIYVSNVYVASAYNPDSTLTHKFCSEFGINNAAAEINDLIMNVDAVYIASPSYTHYDYIKEALNSGKHVLCETSVTENYQQAKELIKLAKKKGLILMLALKTAYAPSFFKIIEEVLSGEIG